MRFEERSLVDQNGFRPTPLIKVIEDPWTLLVITSWGRPEAAQLVQEKISEKLFEAIDSDATKVGVVERSEPTPVIKMRDSILHAQNHLLEIENETEWQSVVELVICQKENDWLFWSQVGCPHILMSSSRGYEPVSLSQDIQLLNIKRPPLPFEVMGFEQLTSLKMGVLPFPDKSSLLLLSSNYVPQSLFTHPNHNLLQVSDIVLKDSGCGAGWIGLLNTP